MNVFKIAKNCGTITISHFARVLHFLKIFVAPEEFRLLVRKFLKDGYTVNYMAFVSALEYVYQYMERCGITDLSGVCCGSGGLVKRSQMYFRRTGFLELNVTFSCTVYRPTEWKGWFDKDRIA